MFTLPIVMLKGLFPLRKIFSDKKIAFVSNPLIVHMRSQDIEKMFLQISIDTCKVKVHGICRFISSVKREHPCTNAIFCLLYKNLALFKQNDQVKINGKEELLIEVVERAKLRTRLLPC